MANPSIESVFLQAIAEFLTASGLSPAPATLGVVEPVDAADLPAIVLELIQGKRPANGLGERAQLITGGVLPWSVTIDLANPVLPGEPGFNLLSPDRKQLILPHGGLVKADGTTGPLTSADLSVLVAGTPRPVVTGPPAGDEVQADPSVGTLVFDNPLPATGKLQAQYFLGQWEQRTARLSGTLRATVRAADPSVVLGLSDAVVEALGGAAVPGLQNIGVTELSSVRPPEAALAASRSRAAQFSFEYEMTIDRPDSSGGIILRIPIQASLA